MEIGLLLLRLVLAFILFTHAMQKVAGWFGGNGLQKQGQIFASLGLRPGRAMVAAAAISELVAALLLLLGLLTPVGALFAAGTMIVAGLTVHLNSGRFWNAAGGGEYPYVLAAAACVLGFTGAGAYSVDSALTRGAGLDYSLIAQPDPWVGVVVILLAAVAAVPFVLQVARSRRSTDA